MFQLVYTNIPYKTQPFTCFSDYREATIVVSRVNKFLQFHSETLDVVSLVSPNDLDITVSLTIVVST
jgi:hypothetical protein